MSPSALMQISNVFSAIPAIRDTVARYFPSSSGSLLPFIPKSVKALFLILILLNSPSFPFQWHIRVWWHAIKAYYLVWRKGRERYLSDWETVNVKRGQVKGVKTVMKRIAAFDDCDYNLHLSNSCYAKNSDPARMEYAIQALSPGFTPGVAMALAGSHFIYIREIPIGSEYTMETRTIGWGDKWYYLVTEFIIHPKRGKGKSKSRAQSTPQLDKLATTIDSKLAAPVGVPAPILGSDSPLDASLPSITGTTSATGSGSLTPIKDLDEAKRVSLRVRPARSDGGIVACIAVWEYCFKLGRLTVPPRIALYISLQSPLAKDRARAREIILSKDKGRAWVKGDWKKEAGADRIGRDIGLNEKERDRLYKSWEKGGQDGDVEGQEAGVTWVEKGRQAVEAVTLGLAGIEGP